jgi:hypothetical protein
MEIFVFFALLLCGFYFGLWFFPSCLFFFVCFLRSKAFYASVIRCYLPVNNINGKCLYSRGIAVDLELVHIYTSGRCYSLRLAGYGSLSRAR